MKNILKALSEISIGKTTTINGMVVTRWSETSFELGTWGKKTCSINQAANRINFAD